MPGYLLAYLCLPQIKEYIGSFNAGGSRRAITKGHIESFEIPIAPLHIQEVIQKNTYALLGKAELNRQINQTLEQMAQALFKSWFVDFDPVIDNALAAGNPIPEALEKRAEQRRTLQQFSPLPEHIRQLFPSGFVFDAEMGWIPEGWEVKTINETAELIIDHRGKTPKKLGGDWSESGYPAISAKNIKSGQLVRHDTIRFVDDELYEKWMKEPLKPGDIAMTSEAPLGELYYFAQKHDYLLSQRLYGLRANSENCSGSYLYFWLQTEQAWSDMEGRATGTTVVGIRQSELRKVNVLLPSKPIIDEFSQQGSDFLTKIESNDAQNSQLESVRDYLLPRLISGELRIPEAQQQAEVAIA